MENREESLTEHPQLMSQEVSCGFPAPAECSSDGPLDLNRLLVHRPAATYFVRAAGDSMLEAGIQPGDILVVDRSRIPSGGDIVVACIDNEFLVKYFRRTEDGQISLEAANPQYRPVLFQNEMELRIFGVVTACIHRFHP